MKKDEEPAAEDEDFVTVLESSVRGIIASPASTIEQRLKAIEAGTKLVQIKHKLAGGEAEDDGREKPFFGRKP